MTFDIWARFEDNLAFKIDTAKTIKEAEFLVKEYRTSFGVWGGLKDFAVYAEKMEKVSMAAPTK